MHADGLLKNEEIYNVFDTATMLNRPVSVALTDKSGRSGIVLWIHNSIGRGAASLTKDHPGVAKILEWIQAEYDEGRTTTISDREMLEQVRLHLRDWLEESGFEI